jgi:glycosyltransferase involved in cell wall biosynthesis
MNNTNRNKKEFLSVVMPVYREGSHIGVVLSAVRDALAEVDVSFEFLLVDDGSPDDTWLVLGEQAETLGKTRHCAPDWKWRAEMPSS